MELVAIIGPISHSDTRRPPSGPRAAFEGLRHGINTLARDPWSARLAPAAVYTAVRVVGLVVLQIMAAAHQRNLDDVLHSWDGNWFLSIARNGYNTEGLDLVDANGNSSPNTVLAFFPAYPVLIGLLSSATSTSPVLVGLGISFASGVVASYGMVRICATQRLPSYTGLICVALFASSPMSVTLSMVYSEALFTALAAWTLVGVLERNWLLAASCCAAAGLVRPSAAVLIMVVYLAVVIAVVDGYAPRRAEWFVLLCPAGLLGYYGWVSSRTGSLTGWFDLQRAGWGTTFDGGGGTLKFMKGVLTSDASVMETANVLVVLGAIALSAVLVVTRWPWPLTAYAIGLVVMTAGSSGVTYSKMRLLVPAFTLLLPVAVGLAKRRPVTIVAALIASAVLGGWFGGYALTGWHYAI